MATIGTFTANSKGEFTGVIKTLTLNTKAFFRPIEKDGEKSPDFRISAGDMDIGAPGRRPAAKGATTYRPSWTIRASRLPSMPPSPRPTPLANTPSSGRAEPHRNGVPPNGGAP